MNLLKNIPKGFFLILALSIGFQASGQKLVYELVKGGDVIGEMICEKIESGDQLTYSIRSVTNFRIVVKLTVEYQLDETYENGVLIEGRTNSTLNGVTQKESTVKKRNTDYRVETESDIVFLQDKEISYSIPEIYFQEPVGKDKIFSQVFATYLVIQDQGDHSYLLESEDGNNIYKYEDGICTEVKVDRSYATFYIKLKSK
ncbi:DUF6134 family protein [Reichenbachiella ulvae]|uniref:DUF3108 domain-containing protein n=1 Tax=Reichenbachiella ulvae TaxID=2980104 RepID=A0ABT3CYN1_9BACT|nr:DUF6134 family protein [Reichenbachiella ulvae]MCV9388796.1 hypothetical protein [Reichenbachiella ulvae]